MSRRQTLRDLGRVGQIVATAVWPVVAVVMIVVGLAIWIAG